MEVDIPVIENKQKSQKSSLESNVLSIRKESSEKINNIVDDLVGSIKELLENDYYEKEYKAILSLFDRKQLHGILNDLYKDYKIDIRIVNTKGGCRVELSQKQDKNVNPFSQLFQGISDVNQ